MSDPKRPQNMSEAIDQLGGKATDKINEVREFLEKDFDKVQKLVEDLKPKLNEMKDRLETEVNEKSKLVNQKVEQNPWMAVGVVGLVMFIFGWVLGQSKRD
ncbi:MAG: hypothetical protein KDD34_10120 [Bdellovibrionales bacterium]|nr:hypothetical protein [Bdellovibrionales bacterium]